jgi:hypothetical protein
VGFYVRGRIFLQVDEIDECGVVLEGERKDGMYKDSRYEPDEERSSGDPPWFPVQCRESRSDRDIEERQDGHEISLQRRAPEYGDN